MLRKVSEALSASDLQDKVLGPHFRVLFKVLEN